ncbi:MAG: CocE/NonD family hydrolase [Candidatus Korobacteraceae bacterium]
MVSTETDKQTQSVVADGMRIDWDVPVPMEDGVVLRADVFRPVKEGHYPVILSYGPYGKGLSFQEGYKGQWNRMTGAYPDIAQGSSNKYQVFELIDPEKWVPDGYVIVRVDSRGAGRSPGVVEIWSPRENKDLYNCIEWAAVQPWSNGKIGLNGISYYAMNQWYVASLQPPHLKAICAWEAAADYYREIARHGGIFCDFLRSWFYRQVVSVQHGKGERGRGRSVVTGELVSGPETLPEEMLAKNRIDPSAESLKRPLDGPYYRERSAAFDKIKVPLLSAANWGGMGLHPRGNFEGYVNSASKQKWLEVHGNSHFAPFYRKEGEMLQKRFFGHFLKGENTGWDKQPPVQLQIRYPGEKFVIRDEKEWPLARTEWTKFYLDPVNRSLARKPKSGAAIEYETTGDGITFYMPPQTHEVEITGPVAAKLLVSSETTDADLFLALRLFDADGKEVLFIGTNDPLSPIGLGWLRASHRKLDPKRSLPYRPYHSHDEPWPLKPGEPVELDIEIWPTSIVVPPGYRLALNVRGKDFNHGQGDRGFAGAMYPMTGIGPFLHNHPEDRPAAIFGGRNRLHFEPGKESYLLLPVIPQKSGK